METVTEPNTRENIFHDHLDVCEQCREQPFNLCSLGSLALHAQVETGNRRQNVDAFGEMFSGLRPDPNKVRQNEATRETLRNANDFLRAHPQPPEPTVPHELNQLLDMLRAVKRA